MALRLLPLLILLLALALPPAAARAAAPTAPALATAMGERIDRVAEFHLIREEAEKLGVRAWLFGGTAAAYGHYVKWDLERESGDSRFQKDRFDYDYLNIYRSTQDLDIVIDGSPKQAEALQNVLKEKYPHLQGSKSAWEVRLLRSPMADKLAILDNPDFLHQHSDSNSTGMVEITKTPPGEPIVRDVMDWNAKEPNFLKDVRDGALHYYFNPLHGTTKFAQEGRNPPILSAIRYLTKAFQYELKLRPEDLVRIKKVIDEFDPKGPELKNSYVQNWLLEKGNGKKLVQNAVDMEYAVKTLDELGLRQKLIAIRSDADREGSLAWWMNKKPLESFPLGRPGPGKTAAELGLTTVAHDASNFLAYESIRKAHTGEPNVFTSRRNAVGEAAVFGEGFYTKGGRAGARAQGYTIRFELDPRARDGVDFRYLPDQQFVVIENRAAFRVIPENLQWSLGDYIRNVLSDASFNAEDKGILEITRRKVENSLPALSDDQIRTEIRDALQSLAENVGGSGDALEPFFKKYPTIRKLFFEEMEKLDDHRWAQVAFKFRRALLPGILVNTKRPPDVLGEAYVREALARPEILLYDDLHELVPKLEGSARAGLLRIDDETVRAALAKHKAHPLLTWLLGRDLAPSRLGLYDEYASRLLRGEPLYKGYVPDVLIEVGQGIRKRAEAGLLFRGEDPWAEFGRRLLAPPGNRDLATLYRHASGPAERAKIPPAAVFELFTDDKHREMGVQQLMNEIFPQIWTTENLAGPGGDEFARVLLERIERSPFNSLGPLKVPAALFDHPEARAAIARAVDTWTPEHYQKFLKGWAKVASEADPAYFNYVQMGILHGLAGSKHWRRVDDTADILVAHAAGTHLYEDSLARIEAVRQLPFDPGPRTIKRLQESFQAFNIPAQKIYALITPARRPAMMNSIVELARSTALTETWPILRDLLDAPTTSPAVRAELLTTVAATIGRGDNHARITNLVKETAPYLADPAILENPAARQALAASLADAERLSNSPLRDRAPLLPLFDAIDWASPRLPIHDRQRLLQGFRGVLDEPRATKLLEQLKAMGPDDRHSLLNVLWGTHAGSLPAVAQRMLPGEPVFQQRPDDLLRAIDWIDFSSDRESMAGAWMRLLIDGLKRDPAAYEPVLLKAAASPTPTARVRVAKTLLADSYAKTRPDLIQRLMEADVSQTPKRGLIRQKPQLSYEMTKFLSARWDKPAPPPTPAERAYFFKHTDPSWTEELRRRFPVSFADTCAGFFGGIFGK